MLGVFAAASDEGCTIVARSIGNSSSVVRRPSLTGVARLPEAEMMLAGGSWAMSNADDGRLWVYHGGDCRRCSQADWLDAVWKTSAGGSGGKQVKADGNAGGAAHRRVR
jgi:hypothetical protein